MKDLEHFRRWIQATSREFLILHSKDLIDSLTFAPENLEIVQQIISCYRQHRGQIAYDTRREQEPTTGEWIDVPVFKDDRLVLAEKDRLVRQLIGELKDVLPDWSIDQPIG